MLTFSPRTFSVSCVSVWQCILLTYLLLIKREPHPVAEITVLQLLLIPSLVTLQRCSKSFLTMTEGRPGGLQQVRRWMNIGEFDTSRFFSSLSTSSRQGSWCHCCCCLDSNRPRRTNGVSGHSSSWVTSVTPSPSLLSVLTHLIICKGNSVWTVFWELSAECWLRSYLRGIHVRLHVFQHVPPFFEVSYSYQ
jgi:hypothetical protein